MLFSRLSRYSRRCCNTEYVAGYSVSISVNMIRMMTIMITLIMMLVLVIMTLLIP